MWVRDIDRAEAIALGLMTEMDTVEPVVEKFNAKLEASLVNIDPEIQDSLARSFGSQVIIDDGRARWAA